MIEVVGVSKRFQELEALQDVSLTVHGGSIYGLVGSNGAGKTTMLKLLAGVYRPDAGRLIMDSQDVFENVPAKERIVFIPDSVYFFPNYTIEEMVCFYARIYPRWSQPRFDKMKEIFNLKPNQRIRTLSKGMQRQVAFWLGLALTPDVMLLDEPLDGLDPVIRQQVKNLIIQDVAAREMSVIISSHNLRDLEDICDNIGILHQGKMLVQKDLDDLKMGVHKVQVAFSGDVPRDLLEDTQTFHYEQRGSVLLLIVRGKKDDIIKRMEVCQPALLDILPLTLEEIFIYEMGDNGYEVQNILY